MRKLVTGLLLLLVSTIGWSGAGPEAESPKTAELSLLVYNTHGLPELIAGDKPRERFLSMRLRNLRLQQIHWKYQNI